jgi:hypothetical protein
MLSTRTLARRPAFQWLLGLYLVGALSSCAVEAAERGEGVSGSDSEPIKNDPLWLDYQGVVGDMAVSELTSITPDIWGVGNDGLVWNRTGMTSSWNTDAGKPAGVQSLIYVAAARRGTKTDVVATDQSGVVWCRTRLDGNFWGPWAVVATTDQRAVGKPAASTVSSSDRLDVWMRGSNNSLWHAYRFGSGAWSKWIDEGGLPGGLQGAPAVFTRKASPLIIDVVARGPGNTTWHRAYAGGWLNWEDINRPAGGDPSIAISSSGDISVWVRGIGSDTTLYRRDYVRGWRDNVPVPSPQAGIFRGPYAIVVGNAVDLYVLGTFGNVWRSIFFH